MNPKKFQIKIESILGGHSSSLFMSKGDQYSASFAIDPALPPDNSDNEFSTIASGILRPSGSTHTGYSTSTTNYYSWLVTDIKDKSFNSDIYAYGANGSVAVAYPVQGWLSDGGSMTGGAGNGAAYYDNYMYFAKATTIARYGPLNGTPAFDGNYWTTTLGKTALIDTDYGSDPYLGKDYSNHPMHRHSDGKLYIADVVDNKGTIHYISTTKTTVEGDTDNGSTYNALQFGYGLYPIAIESYGSQIVIGLRESNYDNSAGSNVVFSGRAKIAFWDTTSQNFNNITGVEFPDGNLTAIKNAGGVLYFFSGSYDDYGFRVLRYIGGNSFEEVFMSEVGYSPHQAAVLAKGNNLLFGSANTIPNTGADSDACVWSLGLHRSGLTLGNNVFSIARPGLDSDYSSTGYNYAVGVSAVCEEVGVNLNQVGIFVATDLGLDRVFQSTLQAEPVWRSQIYKIGQPFKITKIRIPTLESTSSSQKQIIPKLYFDNGAKVKTLQTMDYSDKRIFTLRPENAVGEHSFCLELKWSGYITLGADGGTWSVALPITIEYELIDD